MVSPWPYSVCAAGPPRRTTESSSISSTISEPTCISSGSASQSSHTCESPPTASQHANATYERHALPPRSTIVRTGWALSDSLAKPELARKFHDNAVRSLPEERAAEVAPRTLALPDAQRV